MAQIFISHSNQDRTHVDFLSRIAAGTKVRLVFEELERMVSGEVKPERIKKDILESNAVFVLISHHLHTLPHTRDWVLWESGVASNRDIWVLEPFAELGKVSVITPVLKHYVLFALMDSWFAYLRKIIESYDDSHVLGTVLVTSGLGAILGRSEGAVAGAVAGLALADKSRSRPLGQPISCTSCASSYSVHLPQKQRLFRCPVCNTALRLLG